MWFRRFCVSVRQLMFPADVPPKAAQFDTGGQFPGHVITVAPPLVLENLLPMDMLYRILQPNSFAITGAIKPGRKACLVTVSIWFFFVFFQFYYPCDAMLMWVFVTATCLSLRPSVTSRYCVKMKKASVMISSPSDSPKILVFWRQNESGSRYGQSCY